MLEIADVLTSLRVDGLRSIGLTGGEPLVVKSLPDILRRLIDGGLEVVINTSGSGLRESVLEMMPRCDSIHVSIDGPNAHINDRVRGLDGAFDTAIETLRTLNERSEALIRAHEQPISFGIDMTIVRSNFDSMAQMLTDVASRFPQIQFVYFGAVVPQGLASRETYESELPTEEQLASLNDPQFVASLRALAPAHAKVIVTDNSQFQMRPSSTNKFSVMTVEPDGMVRALTAYQGVVGNILHDDPRQLWQQCNQRLVHPFVTEQLSQIRTMKEWAAATRRIDSFFASPDDLARIARRTPYTA